MAILDIFKRKPNQNAQESNTLFGQTALGNRADQQFKQFGVHISMIAVAHLP